MNNTQLAAERLRIILEARQYKDAHRREFTPEDTWYLWQHEGFESLALQIMILAGNRTGKTMSAGFHHAVDVTLDYPDWWRGFRFEHAINSQALGVDNQQLKDVVQTELFGQVVDNENGRSAFTGGWVHKDEIGRIDWSPIMKGLARRVEIKTHRGSANLTLRSYTQSKTGQGSLSFAGTSLDRIWVDECPPDDLVGQLVTRTMTGNYNKGGRIHYTMTPELGLTKLVTNFMEFREESQHLIGPVTWAECPHLTPEIQKTILDSLPEHEREMRSMGVPYFGEGLVFPIPDERILTDPFEPGKISWLRYIRAIDLGISHPTAIAWLAYDPEIDRIYVLRTYSQKGDAAAIHAAAANSYLEFAPCVFPHDVDQREKGSGKTVRQFYADAGLKNTLDFTNPDGSRYVEPGVLDMYERMRTDRFKLVRGQTEEFLREKRLYHRDKGKIVPLNDDVISAVRYGAMMIPRYGVPFGGHRRPGAKPKVKRSFV